MFPVFFSERLNGSRLQEERHSITETEDRYSGEKTEETKNRKDSSWNQETLCPVFEYHDIPTWTYNMNRSEYEFTESLSCARHFIDAIFDTSNSHLMEVFAPVEVGETGA